MSSCLLSNICCCNTESANIDKLTKARRPLDFCLRTLSITYIHIYIKEGPCTHLSLTSSCHDVAHLDVHDPGVGPQPGQQRHTPGQHGPGHPVAQLVHGAERDVGLSHLDSHNLEINLDKTMIK